MRSILGNLRRTVQENNMIEEGDRVAVGLSGGKDSMVLLALLATFKRFAPFHFDLEAITIHPGFDNFDLSEIEAFCKHYDVPYTIVKTDIAHVVFDIRKEKNPCSLCANMRRGILSSTMNERNLNKLALGHHQDDRINTFFMNMLYTGKLNTMEYKSYLSRTNVHVIRPLLNVPESQILSYVKQHEVPVAKSPCPVDKHTKREEIDKFAHSIYQDIPRSRASIVKALINKEQSNLFKENDDQ